jgi:hypothetical protein
MQKTKIQEESVKKLAARLWELSGWPEGQSERFYYEALGFLQPHFNTMTVLDCDCCGKRFVGSALEAEREEFVFCSSSCKKSGPK